MLWPSIAKGYGHVVDLMMMATLVPKKDLQLQKEKNRPLKITIKGIIRRDQVIV
jgi:hypothetical protein